MKSKLIFEYDTDNPDDEMEINRIIASKDMAITIHKIIQECWSSHSAEIRIENILNIISDMDTDLNALIR